MSDRTDPLDAWRLEHGDAALLEGWLLAEVSEPGHDVIEIERDDDQDIFGDDDEAGAHVIANAWLGNATAKAAVDLLFKEGCYQALAEAAAAFVEAGYNEMTSPDGIPALLAESVAGIHPRHLPHMPAIILKEQVRVDPATGITVYTNAEAAQPYRLRELNDSNENGWIVRLIFHATANLPARHADVQLARKGVDPGRGVISVFEINDDDERLGEWFAIDIDVIDAIVIY